MVYFLQLGSAIKIGYTTRPIKDRIRSLATGMSEPPILLASLPGDRALEKRLHRRFEYYRLRGEWFLDSLELRQWINRELGRARQQHWESLNENTKDREVGRCETAAD